MTQKNITPTKQSPAATTTTRIRNMAPAAVIGAAAPDPMRWSIPQGRTRHHWWWYPVIIYLGLEGALLYGAYSGWAGGLAVAMVTIAVITISVTRQPAADYELTEAAIIGHYHGRRDGSLTFTLADYTMFTVVELPQNKLNPPRRYLVLRPKPRFSPSRYIQLTGDTDTDARILDAVAEVIPWDENDGFGRGERIFMRFCRALGMR
jgi:hypothetical protein